MEEIYQTFRTTVVGVTHKNPDGTNRQDILVRCRAGEPLALIREIDNPHDRWAIAVCRMGGQCIGYVPGGDQLLAQHLDAGGRVRTTLVEVTGGPTHARSYGCVIEIGKGGRDWKRYTQLRDQERPIVDRIKMARKLERSEPEQALALYREAIVGILEFDAQGLDARATRSIRHPINRLTMLLERLGRHAEALATIDEYERFDDYCGLLKADADALATRKARLRCRG